MSSRYSFLEDGVESLEGVLDPSACQSLYDHVLVDRPFSPEMFVAEDAYRANPVRRHVNPIQGERNLIESYDLSFIEENPRFQAAIGRVLGRGYKIERRKFVISLPQAWVPAWVCAEIEGASSANINPYLRPEFRDVTYMQGIDFHQDMIDFRDREPDFVTCYVYLAPVGADDSPIHLIPGSHRLGATTFPHDLEMLHGSSPRIRYRAGEGRAVELRVDRLTGGAGQAWFWHSCLLHGTRPNTGDRPRVSVRYIIQKDAADPGTLLDRDNARLLGSRSLARTRVDVDESGALVQRRNVISGDAPTR